MPYVAPIQSFISTKETSTTPKPTSSPSPFIPTKPTPSITPPEKLEDFYKPSQTQIQTKNSNIQKDEKDRITRIRVKPSVSEYEKSEQLSKDIPGTFTANLKSGGWNEPCTNSNQLQLKQLSSTSSSSSSSTSSSSSSKSLSSSSPSTSKSLPPSSSSSSSSTTSFTSFSSSVSAPSKNIESSEKTMVENLIKLTAPIEKQSKATTHDKKSVYEERAEKLTKKLDILTNSKHNNNTYTDNVTNHSVVSCAVSSDIKTSSPSSIAKPVNTKHCYLGEDEFETDTEMDTEKDDNKSVSPQILLSLSEKYRPKTVSDVHGNKANVEKLSKWVKERKQALSSSFLVAFIYGPPGIGKTSMAHAVLKDNGYQVREVNCSLVRASKQIWEEISHALNTQSLVGQTAIVLDEIDGGMDGDSGAVGSIIKALKWAKENPEAALSWPPIICIANEVSKSTKRLLSKTLSLRFFSLFKDDMTALIHKICAKEGIKITNEVIYKIIEGSCGDVRRMLGLLESFHLHSNENIKSFLNTSSKDVYLDLFKMTESVLFMPNLSLSIASDLVQSDRNMMTLMVQENASKLFIDTWKEKNLFNNHQDDLFDLATMCEAISDIDLFDANVPVYKEDEQDARDVSATLLVAGVFATRKNRHLKLKDKKLTFTEYFKLTNQRNGLFHRISHFGDCLNGNMMDIDPTTEAEPYYIEQFEMFQKSLNKCDDGDDGNQLNGKKPLIVTARGITELLEYLYCFRVFEEKNCPVREDYNISDSMWDTMEKIMTVPSDEVINGRDTVKKKTTSKGKTISRSKKTTSKTTSKKSKITIKRSTKRKRSVTPSKRKSIPSKKKKTPTKIKKEKQV